MMAASGDEDAAAEGGFEDAVDDLDPQMEEDGAEDVLDDRQQENPGNEAQVCCCGLKSAQFSRSNGHGDALATLPWLR